MHYYRRRRLATTFARRTATGAKSRHKDLFTRLNGNMRTRSGRSLGLQPGPAGRTTQLFRLLGDCNY